MYRWGRWLFAVGFGFAALLPVPADAAASEPFPVCAELGPAAPASIPAADQQADTLLARDNPKAAGELYKVVLAKDPLDECAARGLARIANDAASAATTPLQDASKHWSDLYDGWLSPLATLALAATALLVVLLVISRLLTPTLVPPSLPALGGVARRVLWWVGFGLVVAAAAAPVALSQVDAMAGAAPVGTAALVAGGVLVVGGLIVARFPQLRRLAVLTMVVGAAAVASGIFALAVARNGRPLWWTTVTWAIAATAAALGAACIATARGQSLRLQVEVAGSGGTADSTSAQYLVAALQTLGSQPPRGLEFPEQTDVSALPDDALTSLPEGRVAKALFTVLRGVRVGVPWRVRVAIRDDDSAVVQLSRNGRAAEPAVVVDRGALGLAPVPSGDGHDVAIAQARTEILLAAAAYVLVALSRRHAELRQGLCGASRWDGVALHALASGPGIVRTSQERRLLIEGAVDADPGNDLARVAELYESGRLATTWAELQAFASRMRSDYRRIFPEGRALGGYEALQLRMLFSLAATWLNLRLLAHTSHEQEVTAARARRYSEALVRRLCALRGRPATDDIRAFAADMEQPAGYLWRGAMNLSTAAQRQSAAVVTALADELLGDPRSLQRAARYDRACCAASATPLTDDTRRAVLADLEVAATDIGLREQARTDPSFKPLRDREMSGPYWRKRFNHLVADAAMTDPLELPMFAGKAKALREAGVAALDDVLSTPVDALVTGVGVLPSVATRWRAGAELARRLGADDAALPLAALAVLQQAGVSSVDQLRPRLATAAARTTLLVELDTAAVGYDVLIEPEDLSRWSARIGV